MTISWCPITNILNVISGDSNQFSHANPSDVGLWFQNFSALVLTKATRCSNSSGQRERSVVPAMAPEPSGHQLAEALAAARRDSRSAMVTGVVLSLMLPELSMVMAWVLGASSLGEGLPVLGKFTFTPCTPAVVMMMKMSSSTR